MIKIGIINDPLGSSGFTPEEEAEEIALTLRSSGLASELVAHGNDLRAVQDKDIDVLIIDYGGMSVYGSFESAEYNIRRACEWAEEHPGKLMVIWTPFTARAYEGELQDRFGHLDNILMRYDSEHYYDHGFIERIAVWTGETLDRLTAIKATNATTLTMKKLRPKTG